MKDCLHRWQKTGYPGVACCEHPCRTHDGLPDQCFAVFHQEPGIKVCRMCGWASQGWTPQEASARLISLVLRERALALGMDDAAPMDWAGPGPHWDGSKPPEQGVRSLLLLNTLTPILFLLTVGSAMAVTLVPRLVYGGGGAARNVWSLGRTAPIMAWMVLIFLCAFLVVLLVRKAMYPDGFRRRIKERYREQALGLWRSNELHYPLVILAAYLLAGLSGLAGGQDGPSLVFFRHPWTTYVAAPSVLVLMQLVSLARRSSRGMLWSSGLLALYSCFATCSMAYYLTGAQAFPEVEGLRTVFSALLVLYNFFLAAGLLLSVILWSAREDWFEVLTRRAPGYGGR